MLSWLAALESATGAGAVMSSLPSSGVATGCAQAVAASMQARTPQAAASMFTNATRRCAVAVFCARLGKALGRRVVTFNQPRQRRERQQGVEQDHDHELDQREAACGVRRTCGRAR
jgi:hypothetical protein